MSIATYATLIEKIAAPYQRLQASKASTTIATTAQFASLWAIANGAGVAPSTAAAPTRATAGALGQVNSSGVQRLLRMETGWVSNQALFIGDRLSHQGGLDGTVATEQTTNLPTAALTRSTDGIGVMLGIEIYTAVGATPTTLTVNYTNTASAAGRTSEAIVFGGTGALEAGRLLLVPLQQGDLGVKSVEGVTLAGSTGTAGNFGVTLFRPIFFAPQNAVDWRVYTSDGLTVVGPNLPQIVTDACLWFFTLMRTTVTGQLNVSLVIAEE